MNISKKIKGFLLASIMILALCSTAQAGVDEAAKILVDAIETAAKDTAKLDWERKNDCVSKMLGGYCLRTEGIRVLNGIMVELEKSGGKHLVPEAIIIFSITYAGEYEELSEAN
jgi:hypothetical protein